MLVPTLDEEDAVARPDDQDRHHARQTRAAVGRTGSSAFRANVGRRIRLRRRCGPRLHRMDLRPIWGRPNPIATDDGIDVDPTAFRTFMGSAWRRCLRGLLHGLAVRSSERRGSRARLETLLGWWNVASGWAWSGSSCRLWMRPGSTPTKTSTVVIDHQAASERAAILISSSTSRRPCPAAVRRLAFRSFQSELIKVNYDIGNSASLGYDPRRRVRGYGHRSAASTSRIG